MSGWMDEWIDGWGMDKWIVGFVGGMSVWVCSKDEGGGYIGA